MSSNSNVYTSSRIEHLAEKLAHNMRSCKDPFRQPMILVPNGNLRKWLKMELARINGAAAGLDILFLETGLTARLFGTDNNEPLTDDTLSLMIYALLTRELADTSPLEPLYRYFTDNGNPDPSRRWQLAAQLARLFRDYGLHRRDYTEKWLKGVCDFGRVQGKLAAAQADLFRELFAEGKLLDQINRQRTEQKQPHLNSLFCSDNTDYPEDEREIHIFGFSSISARHMQKLKELSKKVQVTFYFIAPETIPDDNDDGEIVDDTRRLWGRASTGTDHLVRTTLETEPETLTTEPDCSTFLQRLQSALSSGGADGTAAVIDGSLSITGCPGIYREVETVYNSILQEMESDPELELTDIAVLTTSIQEYLPPILSIFEGQSNSQNSSRLIFNLSDTSAYEESVYAQALLALIGITDGELSRKDVFSLIRNPAIQTGRKINENTAEIWAEWTDGLRIFRTAGEGGKSWKFGLQRLRLSAIMRATEDNPDGFCGRQPWQNADSDDGSSVAKFSSFIEDLTELHSRLKSAAQSAIGWKNTIEEMMDRFLGIPRERKQEVRVRLGVEQALDKLALADTAAELAGVSAEIPLALVRDYLASSLQGIPVTRGQYLTGGVTISSLLPMRPVPFKQIYILGLQEGKFPGTTNDSLLDLRTQESGARRKEDLTTPELNRALFLETILCAREKLHLSFVDRDLQKDREFFPCSTLNRLRKLATTFLSAEEPFPIIKAPLKGYSTAYIDGSMPFPLPNYSSMDRLLCLKRLEKQDRLPGTPDLKQMKARYPEQIVLNAEQTEQEPLITVTLFELKRFLENPCKARLKRRIYTEIDPKEDSSVNTHPDLSSGYDVRDPLLERMVDLVFAGVTKPLPELEQLYNTLLSSRQLTPDGAFHNLDWIRLSNDFSSILHGDNGLLNYRQSTTVRLPEFSPARLSGSDMPTKKRVHDIHLDTLLLDNGRKVRITGELPWVQRSRSDDQRAFITQKYGSFGVQEYHTLLPMLFTMAEQALRKDACPAPEVVLMETNALQPAIPLAPVKEECRASLKNLVTDYLTDATPEAMPLKGILNHLQQIAKKTNNNTTITPTLISQAAENFSETFSIYLETTTGSNISGYDSWQELTDASVPDSAGEILIRRILPLFNLKKQEQDA